jgi:transposase
MDKKTISNWIMYHQIHKMLASGSSLREISSFIGIDRRTVKKLTRMNEQEYEAFLCDKEERRKLLTPYESFVKEKLLQVPSASAAQLHDWLKEHHDDFPETGQRTVYNFVIWVRQKYHILQEAKLRDYFPVEELPYGAQGQVDFGQYTLRCDQGRKKVYFFSMVLSRSRYKFVYFSDRSFTTKTAVDAHEAAFKFFEGIPLELVYDQDRLFLVDENLGDLLLTREFKTYVHERDYRLYFCRKSDPESKGKIENVIGYIKKNFLYGRVYHDIQTLQLQAVSWLARTGNAMVHGATGKVPKQEWQIEKQHLSSWAPISLLPDWLMSSVLKNNTFNYSGNAYSLPLGTYTGKKANYVKLRLDDDMLQVYDPNEELLCRHKVPFNKGNLIINTDHKRDKSAKINELIGQTAALFQDKDKAERYLLKVKELKPRYVRDQLLAIRDAVSGASSAAVESSIEECMVNAFFDAGTFKQVLKKHDKLAGKTDKPQAIIKLLDPSHLPKAETRPASSDINLYEDLFNNKPQ